MKTLLLSCCLLTSLHAEQPGTLARSAVAVSLGALVGAKVADYHTSVECRCYESNRLYATSGDRFNAPKYALFNGVLVGSVAAVELVWMHKHPHSRVAALFTVFNLSLAVPTGRTAYRNTEVQH